MTAKPLPITTGATDVVQETMAKLANLTASPASTEVISLENAVHDAYAALQGEGGGTVLVETGITSLDNDVGGIGLGDMLVIGARPSMGKEHDRPA